MLSSHVPDALRDRLGPDATAGLLDVVETAKLEGQEDVLKLSTERFERRLSEECGKLRLEMSQMKAELRQEIRDSTAALRVDVLKWSFLFWIGQVAAITAIMAALLRAPR